LTNKNIDFALGKNITYIENDVGSKSIKYIVLDNTETIYCDKLVLATPPSAIVKLLTNQKHLQNCFGDFEQFKQWSDKTEYIEYISITYHFQNTVQIPEAYGLTFDTEWGVLCVNLSDYMKDIEKGDNKVLSVALTICDKRSSTTGRTANQSTKNELIKETFRQLKASLYPDLPDDYVAIVSPNNFYNLSENKWDSVDEAYFHTIHTHYVPNTSKVINNIYNVGTHNGNSHIQYTTMESAVSNAIYLSYQMYPELEVKYKLKNFWKLKDIILLILVVLVSLIVLYLIYKSI
jgi:hypothetical protein